MFKANLFLKRNASTILTCIGAGGVIATAIFAVKATPKALELLKKTKEEKGEELTKLEIVKTAGPAYIPSIAIGLSTIACIFGANVVNARKQAALMSAYALLDRSYKEYRNKVKTLLGEDTEKLVQDELARDTYKEEKVTIEEGNQLFFDFNTLQYFESTIDKATMDDGLECYIINIPEHWSTEDYWYLRD